MPGGGDPAVSEVSHGAARRLAHARLTLAAAPPADHRRSCELPERRLTPASRPAVCARVDVCSRPFYPRKFVHVRTAVDSVVDTGPVGGGGLARDTLWLGNRHLCAVFPVLYAISAMHRYISTVTLLTTDELSPKRPIMHGRTAIVHAHARTL